ncbi:MAG: TetR/AcrR family transcriptional regulator [Chrysiogenetes bacterium]|nr:TetR/AcrR family transcriptional regulator [Chrysiogenetes bacterium]
MQAEASTLKSATSRGRADWVLAAIELVAAEGESGVRIDRLCRDLGVTKGSFYHHFGSRQDLIDAVADYWSREQPLAVIADLRASKAGPFERLVALTRVYADLDIGARDHAMRAWATSDPTIAAAVESADGAILKFLDEVLLEMGVPKADAFALARVLMFSTIGLYSAAGVVDEKERRRVASWLVKLIEERKKQ